MQEQAVHQSGWGILSFRSSTNTLFKVETFSEICRKEDGPDTPRWIFEWLIIIDWQMQNRVSSASSRQYILTENIFGWKTAVNQMEELDSIRNCTFLERKHLQKSLVSTVTALWTPGDAANPNVQQMAHFSCSHLASIWAAGRWKRFLCCSPQQDRMSAGRMKSPPCPAAQYPTGRWSSSLFAHRPEVSACFLLVRCLL